jgi:hypothetical protein
VLPTTPAEQRVHTMIADLSKLVGQCHEKGVEIQTAHRLLDMLKVPRTQTTERPEPSVLSLAERIGMLHQNHKDEMREATSPVQRSQQAA